MLVSLPLTNPLSQMCVNIPRVTRETPKLSNLTPRMLLFMLAAAATLYQFPKQVLLHSHLSMGAGDLKQNLPKIPSYKKMQHLYLKASEKF